MRSQQDGDGSSKFDGEAARGTHLRDAVAEGADDVVSVAPEAEAQEKSCDDEKPYWSRSFSVYGT